VLISVNYKHAQPMCTKCCSVNQNHLSINHWSHYLLPPFFGFPCFESKLWSSSSWVSTCINYVLSYFLTLFLGDMSGAGEEPNVTGTDDNKDTFFWLLALLHPCLALFFCRLKCIFHKSSFIIVKYKGIHLFHRNRGCFCSFPIHLGRYTFRQVYI